MRCKNCGWPNKPDAKICVKCHAPLDNQSVPNHNSSPSAPYSGKMEDSLKKTVLEQQVFGMQKNLNEQGNRPDSQQEAKSICPKCGYPLRPGVDKCPNCNFLLNQADKLSERESDQMQEETPPKRRTRMNDEQEKRKMRGTYNPYMMNISEDSSFSLLPVKRINERRDFSELEYSGDKVVLTRENTEADNASITSHEQAVITHEDGRWYLKDLSELKTTFVQANHKIELHDGDVILLGNRLFEFHD